MRYSHWKLAKNLFYLTSGMRGEQNKKLSFGVATKTLKVVIELKLSELPTCDLEKFDTIGQRSGVLLKMNGNNIS